MAMERQRDVAAMSTLVSRLDLSKTPDEIEEQMRNAYLSLPMGSWAIDLWGTNLTDEHYFRASAGRQPQFYSGQPRPLDLILTGRPVDATEALAMGLANRVVPPGQALAAAREGDVVLVAVERPVPNGGRLY